MNDPGEPLVHYESYLLRLRYVVSPACPEPAEGPDGGAEQEGRPTCQVMLTSVATQEQRYFADLENLVAYLQAQAPGQGVDNPAAQGREEETI